MSRFLQIHALTFYPPSNLNRDDLGRPKTATMGGKPRLRISSQCLKRSWRTSDIFKDRLGDNLGIRTKKIGSSLVKPYLIEAGISEENANAWAASISNAFASVKGLEKSGKPKKKKEPKGNQENEKKEVDTQQLVHLSPDDQASIQALTNRLIERQSEPTKEELAALRSNAKAVDIALFGRMLADHPIDNVNAATQVAHAISVNQVAVEDDFFTAVDDLNPKDETGAGHVDEHWYGSGTFYIYVCINRELLTENLGGDEDLANQAIRALTEAIATVSPSGMQNSFAALARASYLRAEKGDAAPRSLAVAFLNPIDNADPEKAIEKLEENREAIDQAYESAPRAEFCFQPGKGRTMSQLLDFVAEA